MERGEKVRDCFCSVEMQLWLQHLRSQGFLQEFVLKGHFLLRHRWSGLMGSPRRFFESFPDNWKHISKARCCWAPGPYACVQQPLPVAAGSSTREHSPREHGVTAALVEACWLPRPGGRRTGREKSSVSRLCRSGSQREGKGNCSWCGSRSGNCRERGNSLGELHQ